MSVNRVDLNGDTLINLENDTVTIDNLLKGVIAHDKSGNEIEGNCTYDADTSDATATAADIIKDATAYVNGEKIIGTAEINLFSDNTPLYFRQNIPRGKSLGNEITDEQLKSVLNGTFEGLWLGDYWEIDDTKWRIIDMDYCTTLSMSRSSNRHNIVLMPDGYIDLSKTDSSGICTEPKIPIFETLPTANKYDMRDSFIASNINTAVKDYISTYFPSIDTISSNRWSVPLGSSIDKTTGEIESTAKCRSWLQIPTIGQLTGVQSGGNSIYNIQFGVQFKYFRLCPWGIACIKKNTDIITNVAYVSYWTCTPFKDLKFINISEYGIASSSSLSSKLYFRPFMVYQN